MTLIFHQTVLVEPALSSVFQLGLALVGCVLQLGLALDNGRLYLPVSILRGCVLVLSLATGTQAHIWW